MVDMEDQISWSESEALNTKAGIDAILKQGLRDQDGIVMESDADETLLFHIIFQGNVKLHSFQLKAPSDGRFPRSLKLFVNRGSGFGFDDAEAEEPEQSIELSADSAGEKMLLKFVKFQAVHKLSVYIDGNVGDEETSALSGLKFFGAPVATTNMKDFKRVAGEAGESE